MGKEEHVNKSTGGGPRPCSPLALSAQPKLSRAQLTSPWCLWCLSPQPPMSSGLRSQGATSKGPEDLVSSALHQGGSGSDCASPAEVSQLLSLLTLVQSSLQGVQARATSSVKPERGREDASRSCCQCLFHLPSGTSYRLQLSAQTLGSSLDVDFLSSPK